jgi:hypothetical protein
VAESGVKFSSIFELTPSFTVVTCPFEAVFISLTPNKFSDKIVVGGKGAINNGVSEFRWDRQGF